MKDSLATLLDSLKRDVSDYSFIKKQNTLKLI